MQIDRQIDIYVDRQINRYVDRNKRNRPCKHQLVERMLDSQRYPLNNKKSCFKPEKYFIRTISSILFLNRETRMEKISFKKKMIANQGVCNIREIQLTQPALPYD